MRGTASSSTTRSCTAPPPGSIPMARDGCFASDTCRRPTGTGGLVGIHRLTGAGRSTHPRQAELARPGAHRQADWPWTDSTAPLSSCTVAFSLSLLVYIVLTRCDAGASGDGRGNRQPAASRKTLMRKSSASTKQCWAQCRIMTVGVCVCVWGGSVGDRAGGC